MSKNPCLKRKNPEPPEFPLTLGPCFFRHTLQIARKGSDGIGHQRTQMRQGTAWIFGIFLEKLGMSDLTMVCTWVISHVPIFHITQPLGINGLLDGYYFW